MGKSLKSWLFCDIISCYSMVKKAMTGNLDIECLSNDMQTRRKYAKMKNIRHSVKNFPCILNIQMVIWKGFESGFKILNLYTIKAILSVCYCLKDMVERGGFFHVVKRRCL